MSTSSRARRRPSPLVAWVMWSCVFGAAVVGFIGFLHTNAGRPLLLKLARGHCPFARGSVDPKTRDELRHLGLSRAPHSDRAAPARPAFGFELGRANRTDVARWAEKSAVPCRSESQGAGLACDAVPATLLGESDALRGNVYFRFDAASRLVGILRMQRTADGATAVTLDGKEEARLTQSLGAPTRAAGELALAWLSRGALRQSRAEHRFRDFSAVTSVTNLGAEGYLLVSEVELS